MHKLLKILLKNIEIWQEKNLTKDLLRNDDDIVFLKQVPVHPRDRLARKTKDDVKFVKQVFLHLQERLKRKGKSTTLNNYSSLSKKSKNDDVTFIKQVPLIHARDCKG